MGEKTGIGWTDSTANFWWGCTEVGPGCDLCYARVWSARMNGAQWGDNHARVRTSAKVWSAPLAWERKAVREGRPIKVFCQSMSDFFDNKVDPGWRTEAWAIIKATPHLRWQLLTKRASNIAKMLPVDWGDSYHHVGFMGTVVNQAEADRDVPRLLKLKREHAVTWIGLSIEPFLAPIDLTRIVYREQDAIIFYNALTGMHAVDSNSPDAYCDGGVKLDWVIIGGESAKGADLARCRDYDMDEAIQVVEQCREAKVAVFHKQLGSRPVHLGDRYAVSHWKGEIPNEWPAEYRRQEFPPALLS